METVYFRVLYKDVILAERMALETALIFVKALFQEWWNEPDAQYTIEKMDEVNSECQSSRE